MSGTLSMRLVFIGLFIGVSAVSYDLGRSAPQLLNNQPPTYSQLAQ